MCAVVLTFLYAISAHAAMPSASCPQMVKAILAKAPSPKAPATAANAEDCLVKANALDTKDREIVDLRERGHYFTFHVPGAHHASVTELAMQPGMRSAPVVAYGSGHFHADALQLCDRLRHAGLRRVHVVDGGIAAWAQLHQLEKTMVLNRLQDREVAAALGEPASQAVALAPSLQFGVRSPLAIHAKRRIVLADTNTPLPLIRAQLEKGTVTLYWVGNAERLHTLLDVHTAQERKRLDGPGVRNTCSAL